MRNYIITGLSHLTENTNLAIVKVRSPIWFYLYLSG